MITPDWSARTFNEMFLISPEFLTTSMYSTVPTENLADSATAAVHIVDSITVLPWP